MQNYSDVNLQGSLLVRVKRAENSLPKVHGSGQNEVIITKVIMKKRYKFIVRTIKFKQIPYSVLSVVFHMNAIFNRRFL